MQRIVPDVIHAFKECAVAIEVSIEDASANQRSTSRCEHRPAFDW